MDYDPIDPGFDLDQDPVVKLRVAQKLQIQLNLKDMALSDLVFASSNPTFVSVDRDGVLTGRRAGVSVITITSPLAPDKKITMVVDCS